VVRITFNQALVPERFGKKRKLPGYFRPYSPVFGAEFQVVMTEAT
jgi:hypothetical protein